MSASQPTISAPTTAPGAHVGGRLASLLTVRTLQFLLMVVGAGLMIVSIFYPYWSITLHAPQYPKGLYIDVFVNKMTPARNVFEVDGLNHYIGMIKLTDAATIERAISVYAIPAVALLLLLSFFLKGFWVWLLRLPVILYPIIFAVDLWVWLYYAGHSLDKHAPMSSSISEFTPAILGKGSIGQFHTEASFQTGFYLAVGAALIALIVTLWERQSRHARRG